jgi:hypothetical protein
MQENIYIHYNNGYFTLAKIHRAIIQIAHTLSIQYSIKNDSSYLDFVCNDGQKMFVSVYQLEPFKPSEMLKITFRHPHINEPTPTQYSYKWSDDIQIVQITCVY